MARSKDKKIKRPAFVGFDSGSGPMFPFLFVTIACGACSGFHGLVCSGTTSKQIDRERDYHPLGYGAMLLEAFVAVIALATIMIVAVPKGGGQMPPDMKPALDVIRAKAQARLDALTTSK